MLYASLCESAAFLRQLIHFGRLRLIPVLQQLPGHGSDCFISDATPTVACRLWQRPIVQWRRVYHTLWPDSYRKAEADAKGRPGQVTIHQTLITMAR